MSKYIRVISEAADSIWSLQRVDEVYHHINAGVTVIQLVKEGCVEFLDYGGVRYSKYIDFIRGEDDILELNITGLLVSIDHNDIYIN